MDKYSEPFKNELSNLKTRYFVLNTYGESYGCDICFVYLKTKVFRYIRDYKTRGLNL